MTAEQRLVDASLRAWKINSDRIAKFFDGLTDEQLQTEVAPGRNRLLYVWGHLTAVADGMLPLLGIGPRLHPDLEKTFIASPDRSVSTLPSAAELKQASAEIEDALWSAFNRWSAADWVAKHSAVSEDDFVREPHRNRFSVLLSRTTHMAFHHGQIVLTKPRD
ncbi:MAG: DinB family protein [Gemmatimonadaceae bacterium]